LKLFKSLVLALTIIFMVGCIEVDFETSERIFSESRSPSTEELQDFVGLSRGRCIDSKNIVDNSILYFAYEKIDAESSEEKETHIYYGHNFTEKNDKYSVDLVDLYYKDAGKPVEDSGFFSKMQNFANGRDNSKYFKPVSGVFGSYGNFSNGSYVVGSDYSINHKLYYFPNIVGYINRTSYKNKYKTEYRVASIGGVISKISFLKVEQFKKRNQSRPRPIEMYCFWYDKIVDKHQFPESRQGPTINLNNN